MHKYNEIRNDVWTKFADDDYDVEEMIHCCANLLIATLAIQEYSHEEMLKLLLRIEHQYSIAVGCLNKYIAAENGGPNLVS